MHACSLYSTVTTECGGELTVGRLGLTMGRPGGDGCETGRHGGARRLGTARLGLLGRVVAPGHRQGCMQARSRDGDGDGEGRGGVGDV
jgi:hypothetical protein